METNHPDLKCQHILSPRIYTSNQKNPGRQFYRCPKPIGEQCSFFLWVDEAIPSPSQNQASPPTPRSSQSSVLTLHEPPSTPTPLSRKRTSPDDSLSSAALLCQIQKRAKHGVGVEEKIISTKTPNSLNTPAREREHGEASMSQETDCSAISEFSADSVARKLQFFNELPDHIRKLERRKVAAEMSRDAKARKILDLQAEVERLKQREKELEELLRICSI